MGAKFYKSYNKIFIFFEKICFCLLTVVGQSGKNWDELFKEVGK
jgi:hypothetical protein